MTNEEKAIIYDDCVRQMEVCQRVISKIKSHHVTSMPAEEQKIINENEKKIAILTGRLESLFR